MADFAGVSVNVTSLVECVEPYEYFIVAQCLATFAEFGLGGGGGSFGFAL